MRSDERALQNELTFRQANEKIRAAREKLPAAGDPVPFICECEDERCTAIMQLPLARYEEARAAPLHFIIATDHPSRGEVVASYDGYSIVRKGQA